MDKKPENRPRSRHLILLFVTLAASLTQSEGETPNYAIQVEPVTFLLEPQSTAVLPNTTAGYSCNITAVPLISDYPLPRIQWRFNGTITTRPNWRNTTSQDGVSHLFVENVGSGDVGYYECVALDGQNYNLNTARFLEEWAHITVSRRARLDLIDLSLVPNEDQVSVSSNAPLLLSCDTGASHPPRGAKWSKNGSRLEGPSEDWVVLGDGSLLVFSASASTSGRYQCVGWVGEEPLNSTSFQVSVTEDIYAGPLQLFLEPTSQPLLEGESANLTCYIAGANSSQGQLTITWRKDGATINEPDTIEVVGGQVLRLRGVGSDQSGVYTCEVAGEEANITVQDPPVIDDSHVFPDQLVVSSPHQPPSFSVACLPSGQSAANVYWYRNGEDITDNYVYNTTSGRLTVEVPIDLDSVLGVYQCFAERSGGVVYSTTRVLVRGFTNPPGNLTCRVENDNGPGPRVVLNWEPPALFTGRSADNFLVNYFSNDGKFPATMVSRLLDSQPVSVTITPSKDNVYTFRVFSLGGVNNDAPAICQVYTLDRITEQEYPFTKVSCADSPMAVWNDPSRQHSDLTTKTVFLNSTCIYGNQNYTDETTAEEFDLDYSFYFMMMTSTVELSVENVPSGAVCLFGGHHNYGPPTKNTGARPIPTEACIVQARLSGNSDRPPPPDRPPPTVRLGLSCAGSELRVSWYTAISECYRVENITVQGRCLDYTSQWEYEPFTTHSFAGNETVGQLRSDSVCSFFGFYYDTSGEKQEIEPAQCVGREPVDERYKLAEASDIENYPTECPTPTPSTTATPTSTATTAEDNSSPSSSPPGTSGDQIKDYVWGLMAAGLTLVVAIVVMLLIIVFVCTYRRYPSQDRREDELKHEMAEFVAEQITGRRQQYSPVLLDYNVVDVWDWYDVRSVAETEFESLVRSEHDRPTGMTNLAGRSITSLVNAGNEADGKPHLMDKFLQSQEDAEWKETDSSGDSGCVAAITGGERDLQDIAGSESRVREDARLCSARLNDSETLQHRMDQLANSAPSSSGYASESYYPSDISGAYPGSSLHGPRNYFAKKLTELEEDYPSGSISSPKEETAGSDGEDCKKVVPVIDERMSLSETSDHVGFPEETVLRIEPEAQMPTIREKPKVSYKRTRLRTLENGQKYRAESPISESSKRSPCISAYYTDDEGYVHMGSAGHVEITEPS